MPYIGVRVEGEFPEGIMNYTSMEYEIDER